MGQRKGRTPPTMLAEGLVISSVRAAQISREIPLTNNNLFLVVMRLQGSKVWHVHSEPFPTRGTATLQANKWRNEGYSNAGYVNVPVEKSVIKYIEMSD